ncbi:MAG: hypothetical protein KKF52_05060 [Nanoarchaeota archaeon]|nr:hypothetical protein [Nanoarchaeota archaeon]MBU4348294.1 hypothetical protein [Patescibacteria group bacterium]
MHLIQQTIPEEYKQFTDLIYNSIDKGYDNKRTKRIEYFSNIKFIQNLIEEIVKIDKQKHFLIRQEKKLLKYTLKIFLKKRDYIKKEEFAKLIDYSFRAVCYRLDKIRKNLIFELKNSKFKVSNIDNEYRFALDSIFQQLFSLGKDFKSKTWYLQKNRNQLIYKSLIIFKNFNELALSIAETDFGSIERISNTILSYDNVQFNVTNKLIA